MLRTKQQTGLNNIHTYSLKSKILKFRVTVNGLIHVKTSERKLKEISTLKLK